MDALQLARVHVWPLVTAYLDLNDLKQLMLTCSHIKKALYRDSVWRVRVLSEFPRVLIHESSSGGKGLWRLFYRAVRINRLDLCARCALRKRPNGYYSGPKAVCRRCYQELDEAVEALSTTNALKQRYIGGRLKKAQISNSQEIASFNVKSKRRKGKKQKVLATYYYVYDLERLSVLQHFQVQFPVYRECAHCHTTVEHHIRKCPGCDRIFHRHCAGRRGYDWRSPESFNCGCSEALEHAL